MSSPMFPTSVSHLGKHSLTWETSVFPTHVSHPSARPLKGGAGEWETWWVIFVSHLGGWETGNTRPGAPRCAADLALHFSTRPWFLPGGWASRYRREQWQ
jgi:hypothetical protein